MLVFLSFGLAFLTTNWLVKEASAATCCGTWVKDCIKWIKVCEDYSDPSTCESVCVQEGWECTNWCTPDGGAATPTPVPGGENPPADTACSGDKCGGPGGDSCQDGCLCCDWDDNIPNLGNCDPPTNCICFTGETQVITADQGKRKIKDLRAGDEVLCFDREGEESCRVERVFKRESDQFYLLKTVFGREVKTTAEHPFLALPQNFSYQDENLPKSVGALFVRVKDLKVGDLVFVRDSQGKLVEEEIVRLEKHEEPVVVYNLIVDGAKTFYANDFAVHNKRGTGSPDCKITLTQQIAADEQNYDPDIPSHLDEGFPERLSGKYSGRKLFEKEKIPFVMGNPIVVGDPGSVCLFGFSNQTDDWASGDCSLRCFDPDCSWKPEAVRGCNFQQVGGACRGDPYGREWYLATCSVNKNWGCPYYGDPTKRWHRLYTKYEGNFLIFTKEVDETGINVVHIYPPQDNLLVYKITFDYQALDDAWHQLRVSRHFKTSGDKNFYYPVPGGRVSTQTSGSKEIYLAPASDSVHLVSEGGGGDLLVYNLEVTFMDASSARGTDDNKITVVNDSIGYAGASGPAQGVGGVWLSNDDVHWTYVAGGDWDQRDTDTIQGFEWDLGASLGEEEKNVRVWALTSGVLYSMGETSKCSDTVSFTPFEPPKGTIRGTVYDVTDSGPTCPFDTGGGEVGGGQVKLFGMADYGPISVGADGQYAFADIPIGQYQALMTSVPEGYLDPVYCDTDGLTGDATVNLERDGQEKTINIGLSRINEAWFQTTDGDVHAQLSLIDPIPSGAEEGPYCSLEGEGGYPGVVSYGGSVNLGSGLASEKEWLANSSASLIYSYAYFYELLDSPEENWDGSEANFPADPGTGKMETIFTTHDAHLPGFDNLSGRKIVVLTQERALIESDITIDDGFLAVFALGDITINGSVGDLQGLYLTDSQILTGAGDVQLLGEGMFISRQKPVLARDFNDERNNTDPAEAFTFRPDLWLASPRQLWQTAYTWQELPP